MKMLLACILSLAVVLSAGAVAQDTMSKTSNKMEKPAPLKRLQGTVKADADKYSFINDKDQKAWDVINPETLKEGHHVQVMAHVYAEKGQIHVMEVKMLGGASNSEMK